MKSFEYFNPTTLKEASELLIKYKGSASILNGGTDLIVSMREQLLINKAVVDVKSIKELYGIKVYDNKISIGACVRLSEIEKHEDLKKILPFFVDSVRYIASKQVRNRATCVGNLCNASPCADTATPLLALDTIVHIYGTKGRRDILLKDLFVAVRKTSLEIGEIVTGITIFTEAGLTGVFTKLSRRKAVDISTVSCTILKIGHDYRVSFGAVAPTPLRLYKTEKFLKDKKVTEKLIEAACLLAIEEVSPISDIRASKIYRNDMVKNILKTSLAKFV